MRTRIREIAVNSERLESALNRTDENHENIVSHSRQLQTEYNTVCAVEYLKSHGIDADVIQLVLL